MGHLFLVSWGLFLESHLKIKRIQNIKVRSNYITEFVRSLMKPNTKNEHNNNIMARFLFLIFFFNIFVRKGCGENKDLKSHLSFGILFSIFIKKDISCFNLL